MRKNSKTGKRLRLISLILGSYAAFLGFGLAAIGLAEVKEGIGIVRLLTGLGMAGFGLLGIWDGVRDLVSPDKKPEQAPVSQPFDYSPESLIPLWDWYETKIK